MAKTDIIQELSDLGSSLVTGASQNVYTIPDGYFEGFAGQVIDLVRTTEYLHSLPKQNPFEVPGGYFEGLEERMMQMIRDHADYQTSKEELEAMSPLLSSLSKRPVFSVPQGYFENFKVTHEEKKTSAKVISFHRKRMSYAAAAVIVCALITAGLSIYNNNHKDAAAKTLAKFEREVKKIDDVQKTESLIDFMDAGLNEKELATNHKKIKTDDVQQLLRDVPTEELKDFNEQSKAIEDVMMTN